MASHRGRTTSPHRTTRPPRLAGEPEDDSILAASRQLEVFGRTVTATASHLMGGQDGINQYNNALSSVHRSLRRPMIQRSVFSFAKANPRELVRSTFNSSEIQQRAITHLPDELLKDIPQSSSPFSLLQGFNASLPDESDNEIARRRKRHGRHGSRGQKLLGEADDADGPPQLVKLKNAKFRLNHRLEMMGIRKTMCASEIREIDIKIANLNSMRKVVLDRLAGLEQEETDLEHEISEVANSLDVMQEEIEDEAALATKSPVVGAVKEETKEASTEDSPSFMSESIYEKLPAARAPKRRKNPRRISMPILHEHLEPGSRIREIQAHNDLVTALDFDAPFGTMVTAALDDTVRVWDLNAGRCMGLLEGHLSSVRCLQVEDNLVATGSMDASIRLWDLSQADYNPPEARNSDISKNTIPEELDEVDPDQAEDDDGALYSNPEEDAATPPPRADAMADCALFTLSSHVAEVTALNMRGNTLVSGSADKTLRQWDLETGRCVQTLDVLWAAAQAETLAPPAAPAQSDGGWWRPTSGRLPAAEADFVGAVQVFDAALACGTADGMVRLWDLRSGMVHRSLVGHTGPVTALQFDDMYLVTGSMDRSIRIWDLRTGSIHDAFAYDAPITSMMFDTRRIVAACGEDVVKVYDKTDGRHWDCGAGVAEADDANYSAAAVERVRIKDGYLVEGRRDGVVGVWSC